MPALSKPAGRIDRAQVRALYRSGLSTRQVAAQLGMSYGYVGRLCRDLLRDRSTAAQLRQPPQPSTHWRTCRQQARKIVEATLGRKLRRDEHVHHRDRNWQNNDLDNLEVIDARAHGLLHSPVRNPIPRHLRPERKAYMREYFKTYRKPVCRP